MDWSQSNLGSPATWHPSLRTTIDIILNSPVAYAVLWGARGDMLYNDAYSVIAAGRHPGSMGRSVFDMWPEVSEFNRQVIKTVLGGSPVSLQDHEFEFHRNGAPERVWLSIEYSALPGEGGTPAGVLAMLQETSQRVKVEADLELAKRETEEQFHSLAQAVPLHVWAADAEGSLYWFNARVYEDTGAERGSLDGINWGTVVHPDDLPEAADSWARAIERGEPYEVEFRIWNERHKAYRWHLVRALPVRREGKLLRWIGTNTDVQDNRLAAREMARLNATLEERVAARTAELDRIWRLSRDLMIVVGFDDVIRSTNPAWQSLLGWDETDLAGRKYMKQVHPDDLERSVQEAKKIIAGGQASPFENRYRHKDGSYRHISWTSAADGDLIHSVGRDVTTEREAATALRQSEDALRQSQKMEAVGQLTGGIAHDFNNLLQGIVGSIEITRKLIGLGRAAETEKFINGAMTSAQRAAALTHRLLAFSRRQPLDPKPIQINQLVVSMEDLLRRTVGVSIDIQLMLAANAWVTKCDANQVENAILNLVINARDAMPNGGHITIRTSNGTGPRDQQDRPAGNGNNASTDMGRDYLCVAVMDDGTGMPPEVVARAFDPFFTTKPTGQGTGLGLSMIYGSAQQSNGFARIRSEVGRGTTVKLYLPRYRGSIEKDETAQLAANDHGTHDGETILVIEDEKVVRDLAVRVLTDLRYRVIEAADGPAGLNVLDSDEHVDLVLTDIGLPGLNGRQVVDAARIKRPDLLVLFMTGYAENAALADGFLESGMGLITKPFSMESLAGRIKDMIAERVRDVRDIRVPA